MKTCTSCGQPIVWAETEGGARMPLDPNPVPNGNVRLNVDTGKVVIVTGDDGWETGEPRYASHFVTCPNAPRHRRRQ